MSIQELYDWSLQNNCKDFNLNISIEDRYHDSWFDKDFSPEQLDCDKEWKWVNINIEVNTI